ncbi:MAG: hypothetical protein J3Q66DRAFT_173135 [Benniella sp.]|nr:MAG: hypothetical protein J3Q66DRAFT_173135 [Benniella sp.]
MKSSLSMYIALSLRSTTQDAGTREPGLGAGTPHPSPWLACVDNVSFSTPFSTLHFFSFSRARANTHLSRRFPRLLDCVRYSHSCCFVDRRRYTTKAKKYDGDCLFRFNEHVQLPHLGADFAVTNTSTLKQDIFIYIYWSPCGHRCCGFERSHRCDLPAHRPESDIINLCQVVASAAARRLRNFNLKTRSNVRLHLMHDYVEFWKRNTGASHGQCLPPVKEGDLKSVTTQL